jgi:hypothetical protein
MTPAVEDAFDTIESAHDFISLLAETVAEARRTLELDVQRESTSGIPRRLDTLRLAQYNVAKLEIHVNRTSRILNDLRTLRRLLFDGRSIPRSANRNASSALQLSSISRDSTLQKVAVA